MITPIGVYSTPHKQSTIQAALPPPSVAAAAVSSPTSALRMSTKISKNGLSELTVMINASWVACLAPVSSLKSKVIPTICDVNHNDPDDDRLMKMTHTGETGYRTCIGLGADTGMEGDPWEGNQQYWYLLRLLYNTQSTKDSEHNPCTWRRHTIPASSMFELAWLGKAMQRVALLRRCLFPRRDVIRWNTTTLGEAYCL